MSKLQRKLPHKQRTAVRAYRLKSNVLNFVKNKLEEAEKSLRQAIKLKPNLFHAHLNLGNLLRDTGKTKEAESFTRNAINLKPNDPTPHFNLGNILKDNGKFTSSSIYIQ